MATCSWANGDIKLWVRGRWAAEGGMLEWARRFAESRQPASCTARLHRWSMHSLSLHFPPCAGLNGAIVLAGARRSAADQPSPSSSLSHVRFLSHCCSCNLSSSCFASLLLPLFVTHCSKFQLFFHALTVTRCNGSQSTGYAATCKSGQACCWASGSGGTARGCSHHRPSSSSECGSISCPSAVSVRPTFWPCGCCAACCRATCRAPCCPLLSGRSSCRVGARLMASRRARNS